MIFLDYLESSKWLWVTQSEDALGSSRRTGPGQVAVPTARPRLEEVARMVLPHLCLVVVNGSGEWLPRGLTPKHKDECSPLINPHGLLIKCSPSPLGGTDDRPSLEFRSSPGRQESSRDERSSPGRLFLFLQLGAQPPRGLMRLIRL